MAFDVTGAFVTYLSRNSGPVPGDPDSRLPPDYGVAASLNDEVAELTLTFRAGSEYCCSELGCHLNLSEEMRWDRLRQDLAAIGVS